VVKGTHSLEHWICKSLGILRLTTIRKQEGQKSMSTISPEFVAIMIIWKL